MKNVPYSFLIYRFLASWLLLLFLLGATPHKTLLQVEVFYFPFPTGKIHRIKHKIIGRLSPSNTRGSYSRVVNSPLAVHAQVLSPHRGHHYRFGSEIQGSCSPDLYIQHPSALGKGRTNLFPQHFSFQLMKQNQLALQKSVFSQQTLCCDTSP